MGHQLKVDKSGLECGARGSYFFPVLGGTRFSCIRGFENEQFVCHFHPEVEVTLIAEGEIYYRVDDTEYLLRAGDAVFVNVEVMHAGRSVNGGNCFYYPLNFWPLFLSGHEDNLIDQKYVTPLTKANTLPFLIMRHDKEADAELLALVKEMVRYTMEREEGWELLLKGAVCRFWYLLYQRKAVAAEVRPNDGAQAVKQAIAFMEAHYDEMLTLKDIADAANLSRSEFCRTFKRFTGRTAFAYLQYLRIRASLPLLQNKALSVTEVAEKVGFAGGSYYAEVFGKFMGCSPLGYRKKM